MVVALIPRAQTIIAKFVRGVVSSGARVDAADLLLVGFERYELDDHLKTATEENAVFLQRAFSDLGQTTDARVRAKTN